MNYSMYGTDTAQSVAVQGYPMPPPAEVPCPCSLKIILQGEVHPPWSHSVVGFSAETTHR